MGEAGAFAVVLELVTPPVAKAISQAIAIPTIGIGSGPDCDGQILVTHDLLGMFPWFTPKFGRPKLDVAAQIRAVVKEWQGLLCFWHPSPLSSPQITNRYLRFFPPPRLPQIF